MLSTSAHRRLGPTRPFPRPDAHPGGSLRIVVLMGGVGPERGVSLASGRAVAQALEDEGHEVETWVVESDDERALDALPRDADVVFLALHGDYGEDGRVQAALARRGLPYTGSGPEASARAYDKLRAKRILRRAGVPLADDAVLPWPFGERDLRHVLRMAPRGRTVVKPIRMGSSVGISICRDRSQLVRALVEGGERFRQPLLIEEYVPGHELTVGIVAEEVLPLVEIVPRAKHYDYAAKYDPGSGTEYVVEPAAIPEPVRDEARAVARRAHRALGCAELSRTDLRYDPVRGRLVVLEVNTIPGLTATSLLPKAAGAAGIGFGELADRLCRLAIRAHR